MSCTVACAPASRLLLAQRQQIAPFQAAAPLRLRRAALAARRQAAVQTRADAGSSNGAGYVEEQSFRIEQVSFGSILSPVGISLMVYGFGAFFNLLPGGDVSSLLLIYGFPITLLGFALSYAQLKPVPCKSTPEALRLRDSQATDIQKQVREDVTRYRYGDEQHLDEALTRIFRFGQAGGIPRRLCPILTSLREEVTDGQYTLVLEFATKKEQMTQEMWDQRQEKIQSFFGPGIVATLTPTEQGMDVALICDGSGAGRGGGEKKDVLPPLMPGMKPRQQA
ncbi:hypothetical protein ABPG77_000287 [Micractinium sp. CCAP 211/92]